jgi:hypothetical protein
MHKLWLASAAAAFAFAAPALAQGNAGQGGKAKQDVTTTEQGSPKAAQHSDMTEQGLNGQTVNGRYAGSNGYGHMGSNASGPMLRQKIRQDLAHAGFSDIHIMAQSFLVRAKDPGGDPVVMIINPNSVEAVTAIPGQGGQLAQGRSAGGAGTMGSGNSGISANSGGSNNNSGTTH